MTEDAGNGVRWVAMLDGRQYNAQAFAKYFDLNNNPPSQERSVFYGLTNVASLPQLRTPRNHDTLARIAI